MTKVRTLAPVVALASAVALGGGLAFASPASDAAAPPAAGVDPRVGGLEIVLGEWAIVPEVRAIRPGRVTFVIRNRGRVSHGFEIELRRVDGHGGGHDHEKAESIHLRPGQSTRLTVNLAPGTYEIECSVGDHDELGMRGLIQVREDAPLVRPRPARSAAAVEIAGFAFKPATLRTTAGTVVTWRNADAAPHTATGKQFSSPRLGADGSYRHRFTRAGTYSYVCALHPGMRGRVVVAPRAT